MLCLQMNYFGKKSLKGNNMMLLVHVFSTIHCTDTTFGNGKTKEIYKIQGRDLLTSKFQFNHFSFSEYFNS